MKHADRTRAFFLTWIAYGAVYLTRKNFSVVKSELNQSEGFSVATLGLIDTSFLVSYALGQFVSGYIGDRLGAKKIIALGLLGSGLVSFAMGCTHHALVCVVLFGLNGLFQSTGWANNIKALEPWFQQDQRGKAMAWWGTCQQVGGFLATVLAAFVVVRFGWPSAFVLPALLVMGVSFLVYRWLPESPNRAGSAMAKNVSSHDSYWQLISNPFLICLSISYFGLKLIRYSLLFWLPFYFNKSLGLPADIAGYASVSFEVGGIVGSIITGWVSDRYFSSARPRLIMLMLVLLSVVFYGYQFYAHAGLLLNCIFMLAIGFLVFGPDALISGACAQDIGGHQTGSVAGFINGVGSLGAILQGALTAYVSAAWGWSALFYVFCLISICSALALMPFMGDVFFATNKPLR